MKANDGQCLNLVSFSARSQIGSDYVKFPGKTYRLNQRLKHFGSDIA